jgi:hypothetical protein
MTSLIVWVKKFNLRTTMEILSLYRVCQGRFMKIERRPWLKKVCFLELCCRFKRVTDRIINENNYKLDVILFSLTNFYLLLYYGESGSY